MTFTIHRHASSSSDVPLRGAQSPLIYEDVAPELRINKLDGLGPSAWADYDRDGGSSFVHFS